MRTRTARRGLTLLLFLAGWLGLGVLAAAPASAHVEIISATPRDGTRLGTSPAQVSVVLSENVGIQPGAIHVVDQRGNRVDDGPVFQPGTVAEELAVRLKPNLPEASYLVEYAFVSADSHPVRGTFAFVVGAGPLVTSAGAVSAATGTDALVDVLFTVFRWVSFAGVALLGGLVFVLTCRPAGRTDPRVRQVLRYGWVLTAVTAVAGFLLQGPYVAGRGVSAVFDPEMLASTLRVAYGKLLLLRLAAVGALAWLVPRLLVPRGTLPERLRSRYENLAMVAGFVVLLTFSASGHAVTDPIMFFSVTADLAHFGAIAVWAGGLVQLALCLRRPSDGEDPGAVVARFSRTAATSVVVVVLSGAYLGVRTVPSLAALWSTTYGVILLLKLAGFAGLLALANVARRAILHEVAGQGGGTAVRTVQLRRLRLAVGAEVVLATAVLGLAAMLSSMSPTG
ncbi:copper resistance CopC/CopD family protein [Amycolatopsis sp. NPDC059027]|uniref:copper resistance CopC/CopD family protein n=1 Tax=unclassified Amycolatopsis TaxID=2618356 RepID=UPI00366E08B8